MLKKSNRIGRNKDFDRAFKLGQSFYDKILGLKTVENGLAVSRLGILVSTKVSKRAVDRNLIKRQIRAIVKNEWSNLKDGKDLVIITLPLILDKSFEEIQKTVQKALKKLNLYK
ncbi:ribonuclease P protein component [Candidatus Falkowbacteria bacterium]|nr:ribonuclease P protein component [Candidatus Falkowbacteria bacterium]OIO05640.1 MAG: ribonuclease P protein component [Candidatus Falkowbacteria bacterium CG1_02_37_21]